MSMKAAGGGQKNLDAYAKGCLHRPPHWQNCLTNGVDYIIICRWFSISNVYTSPNHGPKLTKPEDQTFTTAPERVHCLTAPLYKISFHVQHIHHLRSQWSLISRCRYLRNLSGQIWSPRRRTLMTNLILLLWQCLKSHCTWDFPIISGGFITCGQEEAPNGHFYLIIGHLDISNWLHNLFGTNREWLVN